MRKQDLAESFGGRFLPGNCERLIVRMIGCFVWVIRFESNDQPVLVHDDPGDELCEGAAIPRAQGAGCRRALVGCKMLVQGFYDDIFDFSGGNARDRSGRRGLGFSMQERRQHVIAIADASFCGWVGII